jgi:hypothetical protein
VDRGLVRQLVVIVAVLATILVNMAAVLLPLNGLTTKQLADRYDVYFVPAAYVFSIWTLIYVGLLAYAVYQAKRDRRDDPVQAAIALPFVLSSAANIAWIFLWQYEHPVASLAAIVVLLLSLVAVYLRLAGRGRPALGLERWSVDAVFSIYLGWVSVATIAAVAVALTVVHWSGWGLSGPAWTVIMMAVGVALAAAAALREADWLFVWAFAGIAVKNQGNSVMWPAWIAALLALLLAGWAMREHRRRFAARAGAVPTPNSTA